MGGKKKKDQGEEPLEKVTVKIIGGEREEGVENQEKMGPKRGIEGEDQ